MILRRFLETVLSALGWLIDMLFPQLVLLTVVLVLGLCALFLLLAWRSRLRSVSLPVRPQS
jgi:protein-S-isoprenylcysteine O-methyltransferase Ste14